MSKSMILRFESHTHTNFSDGYFYKVMIRTALKKKINILAITDHNTLKGYDYCVRYIKECSKSGRGELFILPAEEVGCPEGDVLAYGITEPIKKKTALDETLDNIHEQGGLAVMAHPFSILTSVSMRTAKKHSFDGIEVINLNTFNVFNNLAKKFASNNPRLFKIGGSDAHQPWGLGIILNLIEADLNTESILRALKKKRIRIIQSLKDFPWRAHFFFKYYIGDLFNVIRTGLRYQIGWLLKKNMLKRKIQDGY